MGQDSKIEWTHHTFNPWIGCTKVSPGCKNCYAETEMDTRRKRVEWGPNGSRSVTAYEYWRKALAWNQEAEAAGERRRVFCASLADVFEDWKGLIVDSKGQQLYFTSISTNYSIADFDGIIPFNHLTQDFLLKNLEPEDIIALTMDMVRRALFRLIEQTPWLDWLLLTKRPENIMTMVPERWKEWWFPKNVWMGTSVENQAMANERIPSLIQVPAKVIFLSCEPLLEIISLRNIPVNPKMWEGYQELDCLDGTIFKPMVDIDFPICPAPCIDWVICGGESGPNKRHFDINWAYDLLAQCRGNETAFFMKQIDKKQAIPDDLMVREFPETAYLNINKLI